jgi:hypothetical protein
MEALVNWLKKIKRQKRCRTTIFICHIVFSALDLYCFLNNPLGKEYNLSHITFIFLLCTPMILFLAIYAVLRESWIAQKIVFLIIVVALFVYYIVI